MGISMATCNHQHGQPANASLILVSHVFKIYPQQTNPLFKFSFVSAAEGCHAMLGVGSGWALIRGWQLTLAGFVIAPVFAGAMALQTRLWFSVRRGIRRPRCCERGTMMFVLPFFFFFSFD